MQNERTPAVLTHVLGLLTLFVGPLVLYLTLRKRASPWLRGHLGESLNHRLLVLAAFVLLIVLAVVATTFGLATVSLLLAALAVLIFTASLVLGAVATVRAAQGKEFRFPLDVRIVR